jgi:hypothetical protein
MNQYIQRKINLSDNETFFLWGMRQTVIGDKNFYLLINHANTLGGE